MFCAAHNFYINPLYSLQGVWSNNDSCVAALSADLDQFISPRLTLGGVLEKVATCLGRREEMQASSGGGGKTVDDEDGEDGESDDNEEEEDDEDYDDDCYYSDDIDAAVMDDQPSQSDSAAGASKQDEVSANDFFTGQGSPAAVHRLIAGKGSSKEHVALTTFAYFVSVYIKRHLILRQALPNVFILL